jgi:hypothetical protein
VGGEEAARFRWNDSIEEAVDGWNESCSFPGANFGGPVDVLGSGLALICEMRGSTQWTGDGRWYYRRDTSIFANIQR